MSRREQRLIDSVVNEKGMSQEQRKEFGKYIERIKRSEGRGGADNFNRNELLALADEFLNL